MIDATVLIYDYGNYVYLAETLAKKFKKVYLRIPWEKSFPKENDYIIGQGLDNVEKVDNEWNVFDEIDIWIFTDLHQGDYQMRLKSQGKYVFGSAKGEIMENRRDAFEAILRDEGLKVGDGENITGFSNLVEYLKEHDDLYIKSNTFRGDHETWHHENYDLSEPVLDELNHSLGIAKEKELFLAKEPIEDVVEIGYDGFTILGEYPDKTIFGIEIKDAGYACVVTDYEDLPEIIKTLNNKLSKYFKKYKYTGWYSSEVRAINDKEGYPTDQTCRFAEPPFSLASEMIKNIDECIYDVSRGTIPDLYFDYKYGVQLNIKSGWAKDEKQAIYYPDEIKDFVKIKNKLVLDGVVYHLPMGDKNEIIGSVIAMSNDLDDALLEVKYRASQIKGYDISINTSTLEDIKKTIDKLKSKKIKNNF